MNTLLLIWLVVAAISITAYFVSNANHESESDEDKQKQFPAVKIVFSESEACPPVMKLAGQRLLASQAPLLPLEDCDNDECTCIYRHYDDRRQGMRREGEANLASMLYQGEEKRYEQRGRRARDISENTFEKGNTAVYETHSDTYYDYIDRTGLMKAMAEREDEDSTHLNSPKPNKVATLAPASSSQDLADLSNDQKKSGRSRS